MRFCIGNSKYNNGIYNSCRYFLRIRQNNRLYGKKRARDKKKVENEKFN